MQELTQEDKAMKVAEVAEMWNCSPGLVRYWIREGRMPAKKFDREYRVKRSDAEKGPAAKEA